MFKKLHSTSKHRESSITLVVEKDTAKIGHNLNHDADALDTMVLAPAKLSFSDFRLPTLFLFAVGILKQHKAIATRQGRRRLSARTYVRMYIMYHCWRKISNYCFTALAIFKTILVFFGVVEAPQDYGRGGRHKKYQPRY